MRDELLRLRLQLEILRPTIESKQLQEDLDDLFETHVFVSIRRTYAGAIVSSIYRILDKRDDVQSIYSFCRKLDASSVCQMWMVDDPVFRQHKTCDEMRAEIDAALKNLTDLRDEPIFSSIECFRHEFEAHRATKCRKRLATENGGGTISDIPYDDLMSFAARVIERGLEVLKIVTMCEFSDHEGAKTYAEAFWERVRQGPSQS